MENLIITEAQVEELLKLATQQNQSFPDRPGKKFTGRYFGDALALGLAAALGTGGARLLVRKLTPKNGFLMKPKTRELVRTLVPALAAAGSVAAMDTARQVRNRRLAEAVQLDHAERKKKMMEERKAAEK